MVAYHKGLSATCGCFRLGAPKTLWRRFSSRLERNVGLATVDQNTIAQRLWSTLEQDARIDR